MTTLLFAVFDVTQLAVPVTTHHRLSPLFNVASEYVFAPVPTAVLFLYHWYIIAAPVFIAAAVNLTGVPAHIGLGAAVVILTAGVTKGLTVNPIALLVILAGVAQGAVTVSRQITESPVASALSV